MAATRRRTRGDWIAAALEMVAEVGVDGLSVEALAAQMGATKGSFYWHFSDRADLVRAALEDWRMRETRHVISELEGRPEQERLSALLAHSVRGSGAAVTLGVITATRDEDARRIAGEVHTARVNYLGQLLEREGLPVDQARARARIAYAAFLGHLILLGQGGAADETVLEGLRAELEQMLTGSASSAEHQTVTGG